MLKYSIFSVPSYKTKYNEKNAITKPIEEIRELLKKNNNYHERLKHDSILKFNLDIDGKEEININELIKELQNFFKQPYEISYTQNKSKKNSYHMVIPKLYTSSINLKIIASKFKKESKYEKYIDNGHLGVKGSGKWMRLTNQLKENINGTEHEIIRGNIEDFVLHYIPEDSILIEPEKCIESVKIIESEKIIPKEMFKDVMKKNYEYLISEEEILKLLNELPKNYCDEYGLWLKITTILKSLNKHEMWDKYSKKSHKYDVIRNNEIWNGLKESLNINWLISELNKDEVKYKAIEKMKKNEEIILESEKINSKYISETVDIKILNKVKTLIIKSTTGTGKSSFTARCINEYLKRNKKSKVISIISRVIMNNQHIETFKKEGIEMTSYLDVKNPKKLNYIVCLNSIKLLCELSEEEIKNAVVYIDEINCLLNSLCLNNMIKELKLVNIILMNLIIKCKRLILTDAVINSAVMDFVEERKGEKKIIENLYKKYENIDAIKINDEKVFLEMLKGQISENKPFFVAFDSCKKGTDFYNECIKNNDKDKFVLITSETKIKITSANNLKNMWVFYSPSVTISLDFSIDVSQNVYLHIGGRSVCPQTLFQMTSRTRNINKLYYFSEATQKEEKYKSIKEVKNYYKNIKTTSDAIQDLCMSQKSGDMEIYENTYFKLFCYYEYLNDVFNTNMTAHYEKILKDNGFKLIKTDEKITKLTKEVSKTLRVQSNEEKIKLLDEYIANPSEELKYENIKKNIEFLGVKDNEIKEYQELILDERKMIKYNTLTKWCKKSVNAEYKELINDTFVYKSYNCSLTKIKHIHDVEKKYEIHILDEKINSMDETKIDFDESKYKELKACFRYLKKKPENLLELKQLYLSMLKNAIGISFFKNKIDKTMKIKHNCIIDPEILNFYLKLHGLKNKDKNNWNLKIYEWYKKENNIIEAIDAYL